MHKKRTLGLSDMVALPGLGLEFAGRPPRPLFDEPRVLDSVQTSSLFSGWQEVDGDAGRKGSCALRQELSWEWVPGGLDVPDADMGDPPACAVPEEFEAVDGTAFDRSRRGR